MSKQINTIICNIILQEFKNIVDLYHDSKRENILEADEIDAAIPIIIYYIIKKRFPNMIDNPDFLTSIVNCYTNAIKRIITPANKKNLDAGLPFGV